MRTESFPTGPTTNVDQTRVPRAFDVVLTLLSPADLARMKALNIQPHHFQTYMVSGGNSKKGVPVGVVNQKVNSMRAAIRKGKMYKDPANDTPIQKFFTMEPTGPGINIHVTPFETWEEYAVHAAEPPLAEPATTAAEPPAPPTQPAAPPTQPAAPPAQPSLPPVDPLPHAEESDDLNFEVDIFGIIF